MSSFERNKMIAQIAMLDKGVIPMPETSFFSTAGTIMVQIRNQLNTLSEDERRIAKRKFRKMHRKVTKEINMAVKKGHRSAKARAKDMNKFETIDGNRRPASRAHAQRNREVWSHMMRLAHEGKI